MDRLPVRLPEAWKLTRAWCDKALEAVAAVMAAVDEAAVDVPNRLASNPSHSGEMF
jgi:hypothetical protein